MAEKPILMFWDKTPPYAVVAAARMVGMDLELTPDPSGNKDSIVQLKLADGYVLKGLPIILKFLARSNEDTKLYGSGAAAACQIDEWLEYSRHFVSGPGLEAAAAGASAALALHTVFVGPTVTIADLCAWGMLQGAPMWAKVRTGAPVANLLRWFNFCSEQEVLKAVVDEMDPKAIKARAMGQPSKAAASKAKGEGGSFDIELPGAEIGKVVTRFPPEPSGYLHIGHAKAALLNQYFAEIYKGKLIVRFDDTNPSKESDEFVENIIQDMERLGLKYDKPTYTSDYFPAMLDLGLRMVNAGFLYADNTDVDTMRAERMACTKSRCFDTPVEENVRVWHEMHAASEEGKAYCMRIKMDIKNANACLRDPVAFRCNPDPHHRTGTKYKCYPTYDFACPYVDSVQGVTHALRTSEYRDREEQFQRVLTMMQTLEPSLPQVHIWDYSRLNFVHTVLSKRKLTILVDKGIVTGWDDPRLPTVQGVLRRGMTLQALKEFILSQGASKNVTLQEWDKIWTVNKKVIDPICPRHTACLSENLVAITLSGGPSGVDVETVAKHSKNASVGTKKLWKSSRVLIDQVDAQTVSEGEEVTLMNWGNAVIDKVSKGADGVVAGIEGHLHLEGDFKKTKLKVSWLADIPEVVPLRLVDFEHLITKAKLEQDDVFEECVNHNTWHETAAIGDANMRDCAPGDIIQLERKGYYRVDEAASATAPMLLFSIPDGRQKK